MRDNKQSGRCSPVRPLWAESASQTALAARIAALLSGGNHWMTAQRLEVSGGTLL